MNSTTHERHRQSRCDRFIQAASYTLIIAVSYVWITYIVRIDVTQLRYDAGIYFNIGSELARNGFQTFADSLRTYGYPLFLAILMRVQGILLPQISPTELFVFVQFLLHTCTAFLAAAILERLTPGTKVPFSQKLTSFAVVQLAPPLLGLTRDILTDSLSVFLFTAFVYTILTPSRIRVAAASTLLALAIVVRPFYTNYGIGLLAILMGVYVTSKVILALGARQPIALHLPEKKTAIRAVAIGLPLLLIVGLQFGFVFRTEGKIGLVGAEADKWQQIHLDRGMYFYKVETYTGADERPAQLHYIFSKAYQAVSADDLSLAQYVLKYPVDALYVFAIKTVGMFQNYEWSTYRTTDTNDVSIILLYGAVFWGFFVYANFDLWRSTRLSLLRLVEKPTIQVIVILMIDLHVLLYSVFTIPESRFIAPMLPVLTAYSVHLLARTGRNLHDFVAILLLSFILYLATYEILFAAFT